jgi:hypothetical protein
MIQNNTKFMPEKPRTVPEQRKGLLRLHCYLESYAMRKAVVLRAQVYYLFRAPDVKKKLETALKESIGDVISYEQWDLWVKILCKRLNSAISI